MPGLISFLKHGGHDWLLRERFPGSKLHPRRHVRRCRSLLSLLACSGNKRRTTVEEVTGRRRQGRSRKRTSPASFVCVYSASSSSFAMVSSLLQSSSPACPGFTCVVGTRTTDMAEQPSFSCTRRRAEEWNGVEWNVPMTCAITARREVRCKLRWRGETEVSVSIRAHTHKHTHTADQRVPRSRQARTEGAV
ncbi:hypothetical protein BKA81DRAFT_365906 [Phyllosticta paracitricarpa]